MPKLLICRSCGEPDREARPDSVRESIASALGAAGLAEAFTLDTIDCMGVCTSPVTIALQGEGRASYVFSGLSLPDDDADIAATCRVYLESPGGWIEDARGCGALRFRLHARIPAL